MLTDRFRVYSSTRTALTVLAGVVAATFVTGCSDVKPLRELIYPNAGGKADGTFYVGEAGVALHPTPQRSSAPIATLALHQKVYRSKLEKGFAYVTVAGGGPKGWVDNAKLLWKLPASSAPAARPAAAEPDAAEEATSQDPVRPEEPSPDGDAKGGEAATTSESAEAVPTESQPAKPSSDADPTIFNPF
jgi:hypothetical protein